MNDLTASGDWRRDVHFTLRCLCGHGDGMHRCDNDRKSRPCTVGGCGCRELRPDARVHYEHRVVVEPIEETS